MTTVSFDLTTEEADALHSWTRRAGFSNEIESIKSALQTVGVIPKAEDYFQRLLATAPKTSKKK